MPVLANGKHEAVAVAYIADPARIGWRAWKKVYPKSARHTAENCFSRLMKKDEFSARVAELAEAAAQVAVMTAPRGPGGALQDRPCKHGGFREGVFRLRRSGGGGRPADAGADGGAGRGDRRAVHGRPRRAGPRGPPHQVQAG